MNLGLLYWMDVQYSLDFASSTMHPQKNVARKTAYLVVVSLLTLVGACSTTPPAPPTVVVPMEVLNPDVWPETIDQTICVAGYTAPVHPATSRINRGAPK